MPAAPFNDDGDGGVSADAILRTTLAILLSGAIWFGVILILYVLSMSQIGWCRNATELVETDGACAAPPVWFWFAIAAPFLAWCVILIRRAKNSVSRDFDYD